MLSARPRIGRTGCHGVIGYEDWMVLARCRIAYTIAFFKATGMPKATLHGPQ
jgi:hypothetical protein